MAFGDILELLKEAFPEAKLLESFNKARRMVKDLLTWHAIERPNDGKLRHPTDGQTWKYFDSLHADFSKGPLIMLD